MYIINVARINYTAGGTVLARARTKIILMPNATSQKQHQIEAKGCVGLFLGAIIHKDERLIELLNYFPL
jgi:hypothetical protein